jgi:hypothetical protein
VQGSEFKPPYCQKNQKKLVDAILELKKKYDYKGLYWFSYAASKMAPKEEFHKYSGQRNVTWN